jgi:four helix bundle protein
MLYSAVKEKSKPFAIRIINLYKFLVDDKREYILSKQLMKSGTSIGANVRESKHAQSKADFYHKLNIALKEAEETAYWLELLYETDYLTETQFQNIFKDCDELIAILVSIIKSKNSKSEEVKNINENK